MRFFWGSLAMLCFAVVGCDSNVTQPPAVQTGDQGHGHAHGHAHGHSHEEAGPHGGHLVELGEEDYHVEWLHDDETGLITAYVLDSAAAADVPISASQITIETKIGDSTNQHHLTAVGLAEGVGTARFELNDKSLIEALKMAGQGAEAKITIEIQGKSYTGQFEHHEH